MTLISKGLIAAAFLISAAPVLAADWQSEAGPEWTAALDAARKEGVVSIAGGLPDTTNGLAAAFQRDTGIRAEALVGNFTEIETRVTREARANNSSIDVYFAGGSISTLIKENVLQEVRPLLLLPTVTNQNNWRDGKWKWFDKAEQYMPYPAEGVAGMPLIDTKVIAPGAIMAWKDLLKPEFKGKIASYDPTVVGPGQNTASYLAYRFGYPFIRQLFVDQDVKLTRVTRQIVEWAARGDYPIVLGASVADIESFRQEGFTNLAVMEMPDDPGYVSGATSLPVVPRQLTHPNATKVFLNWYLSQNGQQVYVNLAKNPSRRLDVSNDVVPSYAVPRSGLNYLDQYQEDFYWSTRPQLRDEVIKALGR